MALRLPGGIINPAQFWEFLLSKKDARSQVPKSRYNIDGHYSNRGKPGSIKSKYGYFLDDSIDLGALDTSFFSMPKVELECQDPQQRQLLEVTRECFESAGEVNYRGKDIGCWVGSFGEDWCESSTKDQQNYGVYRVSGWGDFALSNRISYEYDLKGPSMTVRTGCSSSLVGFHEACLAIRCGECSAAIVGGANLIMAPGMTTIMTEQGVLSPEGSCKTFDMSADGYARGEAINVVYIKRLSDALRDGNPIRAIIRATSSNCDGKTVGITQPSSESHEAMIRRAYFTAGINEFSDTGFIECHGTGTQTGDPIEVTAVGNVFGEKGVYIGSVKPNVGHSEGASGISSLIKAVLALENRTIPPNIKFNNPNPKIPWREKKLCVPTEPTPWPQDRVERVGVNSFGIGGANVHVIIDSTRSYLQNFESFREDDHSTQTHLMLYSANTPDSLRRQVINFQQYLNDNPNFSASLAYTLANRREHLPHRAFSIVGPATAANTSSFTKAPTSSPGVIMVFTGQGAQWAQMGLELLENNAIFKDSIRAMDDTLRNLSDAPGWSIEEELAKPTLSSNLASAVYSQPLCTAIQIALVDVLRVIGVQPYAVVGHSSGEMAAAYAGGRLTAREAIIAAYYRGVVSGQVSTLGCMAAIGMSFDETAQYLEDGVVIACENSPSSVTISGDLKPVNNVLSKIQASNPDVLVRVLKVDKAYHSHHMKEVGPTYLCLSKHHIKGNVVSPSSPIFFSSVSGKQLLRKQILGANYWQLNLESPVLFRTAMANLLSHLAENGNDKNLLFLEVGPHSALQGPLRQILAQVAINAPYISSLVRGKNSEEALLSAVGQLHLQNVRIKFSTLTNPNGNAKVLTDVPTYPWEHNASYIYESRLSKEWRLRKFSKHELLGLRVAESTDSEPVWRNMFHIDHAAWIRDHNIKGDIIYPCAGYVAMVGEAVRQLATSNSKNDEAFVGYGMSDIIVSTALVLSETKPTEIITSLKKHRLTDSLDSSWWEFTVSSYNGSGWMKHCSGLVLARMGEEIQSENPIDPMPRSVESVRWYDTMRRMGANYGPYFQGLTNITSATTYNSAVAQTIDTSDKDDDSFYTTHPTQIDFFLQLFTVAHAKGINRNASHKAMVPTGIDELDVFISDNNLTMEIMTTSSLQGTICGGGKAITKDRGLALRVKGVTLTPLEGDDTDQVQDPHAAARLEWQPDIDFVDSAKLIKSTVDRKVYFAKLSKLTEFCIAESLYRLSGVTTSLPHLEKFREWMQKRSSAELTKRSNLMTDIQSIVAELSSTPAVPIIIPMMKVLDNIVEIFTGKAEPVEILMADQTLTKLYNFMDEGDRSLFIQTLGHSKPNMRVLEIGAGTGGTTHTILQNLRHSNGNLLYSKYTFTDISSGFFSAAKNRFDQYPNIEFATLDISKDPLGQNFEPHSYDLIIATNVLHATPSLCETLGHVHTLLHPEGRLLMQELCSNDKSGNFIMGVLPGWWLGDADNRSEEPYVSPERWDEELKSAGFRGLDAVVYDAPESMHMGAFMVARPEQIQHQDQTRKVAILYDDNSLQLAEQFQHILMDKKCSITLFCLGDTVPENHDILSVVDVRKPFFEALSEETLNSFQSFISATVNSGVFWVTGSSQMGCEDPSFAQSIGAIRSIRSEFCMDFATCEVDNIDSSVSKVVQVFEKFLNCRQYETQQQNYEYVASKDMVYISRFYPFSLSKELQTPVTASEKESALNLTIAKYGRLGTLQWTPRPFRELGSDEVDIDIGAVGMNFKDILIAMGIVGSNSASLGLEGAGIVKNVGSEVTNMVVGDRVLVFGAGCFSTSLIVPETLCAKIPDDLSLEDAATMPCVFSTVIYSLLHIGQLKKGMSVLIHSACGGVGIAAIQLCRVLGAEIFCTVSNEEKVQYLISTFALPRHRIFNSRDASFLPGVLRETNGVGVDLVLNSLSGELLHASWKCVAEFGTMLEIGKRDLIGKGKLAMEIFEANRNYCGIDLAHLIEAKPALGKK
jgi:acyl transferase domain-containing protein/NADPH:quinone reductase-like Zn-dependent oxidoreductase/2-polyprenyl-3-methyl-5-hydroxy-6-metoxy-1,4-benzoquinol methylase